MVYAFFYYDLISLNPAVVRMHAKYGIVIVDCNAVRSNAILFFKY